VTTIQQIEGSDWGDPPADGSTLVTRCTQLRRKPLAELTVEDLRIMLGQEIGVPILLPLAIEILTADPLAEGDFYPGDLLVAVLRLPDSAWSGRADQRERLAAAGRAAAESGEAD
jgi:contact-dependent growth inhibition (CDI) system CdiI-like immunity protein